MSFNFWLFQVLLCAHMRCTRSWFIIPNYFRQKSFLCLQFHCIHLDKERFEVKKSNGEAYKMHAQADKLYNVYEHEVKHGQEKISKEQ